MLTPKRTDAATATLGIGAAAAAILCCAGMPILAALLGGLALSAILALGFGSVLLGALAWTATALFMRKRRHGGCDEHNGQQ